MRHEGAWNTANQLLRQGEYLAAASVCTGVLEDGVSCDWLLLRARAFIALDQQDSAERDLRRCLALNPGSPEVQAMLADLARSEDAYRSGEHYRQRSRRLDTEPGNANQILRGLTQSTGAVEKLPAATASVGWNSRSSSRKTTNRLKATERMRPFAEGTTPAAERPKIVRPERFGEYLVALGHIDREQLEAALAYHRALDVRIGEAIVLLGFASEPRVEWAARSFHDGSK